MEFDLEAWKRDMEESRRRSAETHRRIAANLAALDADAARRKGTLDRLSGKPWLRLVGAEDDEPEPEREPLPDNIIAFPGR